MMSLFQKRMDMKLTGYLFCIIVLSNFIMMYPLFKG